MECVQKGEGLTGTIEFFSGRGCYHYDGHRKCGVCPSPREAEKWQWYLSGCAERNWTMGVDHRTCSYLTVTRVQRPRRESGRPYESLMPLPEGDLRLRGIYHTKKFRDSIEALFEKLGAEFTILERGSAGRYPEKAGGEVLAEGIRGSVQEKCCETGI